MGQHETQERWYLVIVGHDRKYIDTRKIKSYSVEQAKEQALKEVSKINKVWTFKIYDVFDVGLIEPYLVRR